ncbi:hypothetical protein AJ79_09676 [Helicocarpus griseus UAMH5409]|uniref:BTB domain-containing protein n=1 Tax=Helicocarpus griseus UAMH5409 TaxID=1447875 RepID=A0A2B7WI73_9EURO|nr:hypothetical protein AJ79_09676 [Helicocarpus griseus UAMH5409]
MLHRSRASVSRASSNPPAASTSPTSPTSPSSSTAIMVSHPDTPSRPPAPASVASSSRLSHSQRRHHSHSHSNHHGHSRSHRSHHGGSTHQPLNQFPIFAATGDVEIVIRASTQERRYLLHRLILARCSGFFEAGTSEEWSRAGMGLGMREESDGSGVNGNAERGLAIIRDEEDEGEGDVNRNGNGHDRTVAHHGRSFSGPSGPTKTRWRYELDWENREEDEVPILVQRPPSQNNTIFGGSYLPPQPPPARTKPPAPQQGFFRSITNLTGIQSALHLPSTASAPSSTKPTAIDDTPLDPTIRDYDNLFRIFYNYPPHLNSINIAAAYSECKSLLTLADMYDALSVVGPRVDHHLLRFSSRLYKQIAKYPPSYLRLGYLARSHVVFAEALIHVVGQWPAALPHLGQTSYAPLPDAVLDLIEDKVEDLEDLKARVEAKLFRLSLTTSRGERVSPTNAYLDWLAVSLFRQWLVENTTPPVQGILKPLPSQPRDAAGGNAMSNYGTTTTITATNGTSNSNNTPTTTARTSSSAGAATTTTTTKQAALSPSPYSPGRTYRLLGSHSTQSYLPHDELKRFLKLHPIPSSHESLYSRENMKRFERKMDEIKRHAREIVKPLMRNFLELDLRSLGGGAGDEGTATVVLPYLTCTRVGEGDFPWE